MNTQHTRPIRRVLAVILSLALLLTFTPLLGVVTLSASAASTVYTKTPITTRFSQSGVTYTIHDATGWNFFCDFLQDNEAFNHFSGMTVVLDDDISVSRMAGSSYHDFCGTFDGQGHTLTFNYSATEDYAAPFRYVDTGCVIKNLHVNGTITTGNKYAAGIIAQQYGKVTIRNCRSSVNIQSSVKGDGTHGGLVAFNNNSAKLTIEGCVFDGKIVSAGTGDNATTSCGGFVGWRDKNGSLTITDSLYAPTEVNIDDTDSATFARNGSAGANCYYTAALGTAQGKQAYTITSGADVTLGLSGDATEYNVSGITAYEGSSGMRYGNTFYAGSGDTVALELEYTGTPPEGEYFKGYTASAGTLSGTTLTMPEENVTINADVCPLESTFDAGTGTLTLKGTVLNGSAINGIVLPNGVNKNNVKKIVVDSSGATFPQDSSWLFYGFTNVTSIDLTRADTSSVTNMYGMFWNCKSLTELNLSGFDTSSVTDMGGMFIGCESLTTLDVSKFDTSSVTDMGGMFNNCKNLTELNVSGFDTSSVTNMNSMFGSCYKLTELNLSGFDTSSVTNMNGMFHNCESLTTLDVSKFDTSSVTDMHSMFGSCSKLTELNLSGFDTSSVTNMNGMFHNCESLTTLNVSGFDTSSVTDMNSMFQKCESLTTLNVSGFDTSSVTDMNSMFHQCEALTSLDVSSFDTSNVLNMGNMFTFCKKLTTIYVSDKWNTGRVTSSDNMFGVCLKLTGGNGTTFLSLCEEDKTYARIDKDGQPGYLTGVCTLTLPNNLEIVTEEVDKKFGSRYLSGAVVTVRYTGSAPSEHYRVVVKANDTELTADENGVYTIAITDSNVTVTAVADAESYFDAGTGTLTLAGNIVKKYSEIALPNGVNKNNVKKIVVDSSGAILPQDSSCLFYEFTNVKSIDLRGADTSSVTDMSDMFYNCESLTELDVSGFDTSSVTDMEDMFCYCEELTSLDLSGFDTSSVTDMHDMFSQCKKLTSLDVSHFVTSSVTNMGHMFPRCQSLTSLDLSGFDTSNVLNMDSMFDLCMKLTTIYVSDKWNTGRVTYSDSMFHNCFKLTGGNGTTYSDSHINADYARIDKDGQPGYLTGVYTLTLPDHMEIVTEEVDKKVDSRYLSGAVVTLRYTGAAPPEHYRVVVKANDTELTSDENGVYTLTMPDINVTVTAEFDVESYFDAGTGTLTLKGDVLNSRKGIVLPNGVNKNNVKKIVVDSSGATLPQYSSYLFSDFNNVTSIDLTRADTSSVTNMHHMFYYCKSLTTLNLSGFKTSKVEDMSFMFFYCNNLTTLNMSGFDTSNVFCMDCMFDSCTGLTTIYVSDKWDTGSVTYSGYMFSDCSNLKGGNGTACDGTNNIDKEYARIDKEGQPGYLTGVYTLTLPDQMEIVTGANENMMVGSRYLSGAVVKVKAKTGYTASNVKANGTALPEENGVYTVTMPDSNVAVTADFAFSDGIGAALAGHSISLDGDIGVNFYMELADNIADSETA